MKKRQQQHILLVDTSGKNWYLGFRISSIKNKNNKKSRQYKKHLQYIKQWRKRNKQKLKEYGKKYYQEHKQQFHEYYSRPEVKKRILERQRKYRRKNKDLISKKNRQRYLKRKKANIT
jgi:hypothetical protein